MPRISFFEVAEYERACLEAARFEGTEPLFFHAPLGVESAALAAEAEVVSVFIYSRVTAEVLDRLPALRLVATRSTGYDHIDRAACRERGIAVAYVPSYGENTVAEHAFALIFALARRLSVAAARTRALDFSLGGLEGMDLRGKVLGVIGAGRIGRFAIRIGRGIDMEVVAYDPHQDSDLARREAFRYASLAEVLEISDVLTVHAALSPATFHLLDRAAFARMKPGALLVNTARGGLIDSEALCEVLDSGRLAGAGLDVFEGEELLKDEAELLRRPLTQAQIRQLVLCHSLLRRENVILTPHVAFFTREGVARLLETSLDNIRAFLAGTPRNLVPPDVG